MSNRNQQRNRQTAMDKDRYTGGRQSDYGNGQHNRGDGRDGNRDQSDFRGNDRSRNQNQPHKADYQGEYEGELGDDAPYSRSYDADYGNRSYVGGTFDEAADEIQHESGRRDREQNAYRHGNDLQGRTTAGDRSNLRRENETYGESARRNVGRSEGSEANWGKRSSNDQVRGEHSGKGPKGYKRSDERICEEINDRLTEHGEIDPSEVEVKVEGGEVTLSGSVSDRQAKRLAEEVAEQVSGVSEVMNQLRIKRS